MATNPDRFNRIDLSLEKLDWSRDESLPEGKVQFTGITDGRIIGVSRLFLNEGRDGLERLPVEPRTRPRLDAAGQWVGQWLVTDGCYRGTAGAWNEIFFWVQDGVIVGIVGTSQDDLNRTFSHMRLRLDTGDTAVVPTEDEQHQIRAQREASKNLPHLRIPGEPRNR